MMMQRVFYHYTECEEFAAGLWRIVPPSERDAFIQKAADLMREPSAFKAAMMRALSEWPRSCAANLSSSSTNRQAWLGHAGCLLGTGSPEDLTRLGWHMLTQMQQDAANAVADEVIEAWERSYQSGVSSGGQLGLFEIASA